MSRIVSHSHPPFLDLPVEGVIEHPQVPQRPVEELRPLLEAVLHYPTIVEFGWQQYTPYDPGEFGIDYIWVRTAEEPPEATPRDLWLLGGGCNSLGSNWGPNPDLPGCYMQLPDYEGPDRDRHDRVMALHKALEDGTFNDVLREAFGDHAAVTMRREGIHVEPCDHH
ncbi:hypothetical protein [Streptomyces sp. NPDC002215]|uniref:hypothetical protein n=1 Tax=Streptomyces sp. NPDC002215 TaxID=3154412 RepID=UPI00331A4D69